jgi:sec-independent protein translocase protein TatA
MPQLGAAEIIIVLVIALIVFGPKRLPELGRGLGRGMRDFKQAVTGADDDDRRREEEERAPTATIAPAAPITTTPVETPREDIFKTR